MGLWTLSPFISFCHIFFLSHQYLSSGWPKLSISCCLETVLLQKSKLRSIVPHPSSANERPVSDSTSHSVSGGLKDGALMEEPQVPSLPLLFLC